MTSRTPAEQTPAPVAGALPGPAVGNPGDARELRQLLAAVLDALTLPYDTPGYDRRILDRARWARATVQGALKEDPSDIGWNADWLRSKLRTEETDAAKRGETR